MEKSPTTPLFVPSDLEGCQKEVPCLEDYVPTSFSTTSGREIWEESKKVLSLAAPAGFNKVFTYTFGVVTQVDAGQFGTVELAAVSLAISTIGGISFELMLCNRPYSIVLKDLPVVGLLLSYFISGIGPNRYRYIFSDFRALSIDPCIMIFLCSAHFPHQH